MDVKPKCTATAIGSLPHPVPSQAVDVIFGAIPNAPIWPQRTQIRPPRADGNPVIPKVCPVPLSMKPNRASTSTRPVITPKKSATFYETMITAQETGDFSAFAISDKFSQGISALEAKVKAWATNALFKVQTTGPSSTFLPSPLSTRQTSIFYNEDLWMSL